MCREQIEGIQVGVRPAELPVRPPKVLHADILHKPRRNQAPYRPDQAALLAKYIPANGSGRQDRQTMRFPGPESAK